MTLAKPTFYEVESQYPADPGDFGAGGNVINNVNFRHSCALRMSMALNAAAPGFMDDYTWVRSPPRDVRTAPYRYGPPDPRAYRLARSAPQLANHIRFKVRWAPTHIWSGTLAQRQAHRLDNTQGIIFWRVKPQAEQILLRASTNPVLRHRRRFPSPPHIDLWDPDERGLYGVGRRQAAGRTMLWAPHSEIVEEVWFWELPRGERLLRSVHRVPVERVTS